MAAPEIAEQVKYFVAILYGDAAVLPEARVYLVQHWGEIDFEGEDHLFDMTDYYQPEMGAPLYRRVVAFATLQRPEAIVDAKLKCNEIEDMLASAGGRRVNLDIGYLDHNKIVLASAKGAGQKIYLGKGIWADLVGRYRAGRYQPFEWTFPDFKDGRYDTELAALRSKYLAQRKE